MRQVPQYLIIGNGRVACHIRHYFHLLDLPFSAWHRQEPIDNLHALLPAATHVLLLVSDQAIDTLIATHLQNSKAMRIHFSGSLVTSHAFGAHPLMSFNSSLYTLEQYQTIPFVLDHDAPEFPVLLPGLSNQHVRLHPSMKAKYHALCVMSGNFSCLLWQALFSALEKDMHIPAAIAHPYLLQQMQNLIENPKTALTGPLVRNDVVTIEKNLAALQGDPLHDVYQSFVSCYQKFSKEELA